MRDCSACRKGKQTQNPIPDTTQTHSSEVLGHVFSNLCRPMEIPSIEGYQYFITFTNDHSQYTSLSLCKHKDDTLVLFKAWKACAERETRKLIKVFCSDGGGEYLSLAFSDYLKSCSIKHGVTNVYTPQENGVSECANHTINTLAQSIIADAKERLQVKALPLALWPQAI